MYQFTSFDAEEFDEAITVKNYVKIKSFVVSAIRNNPTFTIIPGQNASEIGLAIAILKERAKEIFEEYEVQDGEHPFNEAEAETWDKDYFNEQSFLLKRNFSKKRMDNLKIIGRKISNFQKPQGQEFRMEQGSGLEEHGVSRGNSLPQNRGLTGVVIIVGIIILILLVVLVAKTANAPIMKQVTTPVAKPTAVLMANTMAIK